MANRYKDQQLSKLDQIIIYAGEERQLCNIYCAPKDREVIIRSVQKTIMSLSKKAAYDLHDILKMPRNGNDGPGGMQ
jgi:regulatory protein YycH of two-component signal transduction system YycFG